MKGDHTFDVAIREDEVIDPHPDEPTADDLAIGRREGDRRRTVLCLEAHVTKGAPAAGSRSCGRLFGIERLVEARSERSPQPLEIRVAERVHRVSSLAPALGLAPFRAKSADGPSARPACSDVSRHTGPNRALRARIAAYRRIARSADRYRTPPMGLPPAGFRAAIARLMRR